MYIYNSKIIYGVMSLAIFILVSQSLDNIKSDIISIKIPIGVPIAQSSDASKLPSIIDINKNTKSSKISDAIFNPKKNDTLSNYLINIYCVETTKKYIKAASGSGVFLSNPNDTNGIIITNAHVARHLLDINKKCVGRTGSPTKTTHTLVLRYIPSNWLNTNNQYVIGDPDQNSTGEFDFAIIETKKINIVKNTTPDIYKTFHQNLKIKLSNYEEKNPLNTTHVYSYPARQILSKNVNNPLYIKKDAVNISNIYTSPSQNTPDSLLDITGSENIDHGSSGGMVISQGQSNSLIGLSSILIREKDPQIVRVVTVKHILSTLESDLKKINSAQTDPFLVLIQDMLKKKEIDISLIQILKNLKLTSVLEKNTMDTLRNLNIIR